MNSELADRGLPVYSANVFDPFGYIGSDIVEDFSSPSVIWGIDGDWMTNTLPSGYKFYPTDHCGVIRLKREGIIEYKYLSWKLYQEGKKVRFSRTYRASIDRISQISLSLPPYARQKETAAQVEVLESRIAELEKRLAEIEGTKQKILAKYLT